LKSNPLEHPGSHEVVVVGPVAAKLAPELEVAPPASGNIAGVDRAVDLGTLAEEAGTVAEKWVNELVIVSRREVEVDSTTEMLEVGLVIVWKTQGGLSARLEAEEPIEACFVVAVESEGHDWGKAHVVEVYHT
jgi:hypothetical protein